MKILNELTKKHLLMNKKRTIVTIIGIVLSTALMMGIGLLSSTMYHNMEQSIKKYNGSYHVKLMNISSKNYDIVKENVTVKEVMYNQILDFAITKNNNPNYEYQTVIKNASSEFLQTLTIKNGRYPKNNHEIIIPDYMINKGSNYQIGNMITLDIHKRYFEGKEDNSTELKEEEWVYQNSREYKIVGTYQDNPYDYTMIASVFTKDKVNQDKNITTFVTFKNNRNIRLKTNKIIHIINSKLDSENIKYNESLLSLYGQSKYTNYNRILYKLSFIFLALVSIACIMVIYNAFQISVMERKKQFGLLASIGTTKKQLRHMVFYEAFIVSLIGIPIGIIGAYIGIDIVVKIINNLMFIDEEIKLVLKINPTFVLLPLCFIIFVIFTSSYLPAKRASKITPIEAIRQNDDIKIKGKKVKTNKLVNKLFGVEGMIALKNIKRNRKKYRITTISIFISVVLFISFSAFLKYGIESSRLTLDIIDYDIELFLQNSDDKVNQIISKIRDNSEVENSIATKPVGHSIKKLDKENYIEEYISNSEYNDQVYIHILSDEDYESFQKEINLKEESPILINNIQSVYFDKSGNRKVYNGPILNEKELKELVIYNSFGGEAKKESIVKNLYFTNKIPFGLANDVKNMKLVLVVNNNIYKEISSKWESEKDNLSHTVIYLDVKNDKKFVKDTEKLLDDNHVEYYHINNVKANKKMEENTLLCIKILLYGFISLVTLIGITSVLNTITTSLALRKKEFAMLRSIGLSPTGFKKILWFESIFFVLKSLFFALPVSFLIILLIDRVLMNAIETTHMLIPWGAILLSIIFSFLIVLITSIYATKKMRNENILEAIREENI